MPLEPESDLHWTAFLYVAGELGPEESSAFERLLDDNQDAREAVATAVELAGAVALLGPGRASRRSSRLVRAWTIALASAACLAMAVLPLLRSSRLAAPSPSEVATAWTGLRGQSGGESNAEWLDRVAEARSAEAVETDVIDADDDASAERALPSWLLSATSASRDDIHREEN